MPKSVIAISARPRPVNAWQGMSAADRTTQRREKLLDAGLEVFGTLGYAGTSVQQLSRAAGLNERYFYESFAAREALLLAVRTKIMTDARDAVAVALGEVDASDIPTATEQMARSVVQFLLDDPRRARIAFIEAAGVSPESEDARRGGIASLLRTWMTLARAAYGDDIPTVPTEILLRALYGAIHELFVAYIRAEVPLDQPELTEAITNLILDTARHIEGLAAPPPPSS
jgi:AcrR family transcriptional regulator